MTLFCIFNINMRRSYGDLFWKFPKYTLKHLKWRPVLNKVTDGLQLSWERSRSQVFTCEFSEITQNSLSMGNIWRAISVTLNTLNVLFKNLSGQLWTQFWLLDVSTLQVTTCLNFNNTDTSAKSTKLVLQSLLLTLKRYFSTMKIEPELYCQRFNKSLCENLH